MSSFVTTKYNSGSYSIGFTSLGCFEVRDTENEVRDADNLETIDTIDFHILHGVKGKHKMADDDSEETTSESEENNSEDSTPNKTPRKRKKNDI